MQVQGRGEKDGYEVDFHMLPLGSPLQRRKKEDSCLKSSNIREKIIDQKISVRWILEEYAP